MATAHEISRRCCQLGDVCHAMAVSPDCPNALVHVEENRNSKKYGTVDLLPFSSPTPRSTSGIRITETEHSAVPKIPVSSPRTE